jgi:signal-transduction protein with cAMP-binding, CBS, and nucleotidyltransferase domain
MKDQLTRLTERTAALGNYNRKYLYIISSNIDKLTTTLEQRGKRDMVHLWSYSMEIPGEMDTVLEVATDTNERLDFLGCYYAIQFLQINLHMVDIVKLELATSSERWRTSKRLMLEAGRMFRHLTKCYMERLLDIFLDKKSTPEFVMLGVGTRADQDDIDLGIVYGEPGDSETLNRAIGRLSSEMFKKATRLHFHLSEHVGRHNLAATIEEYEQILKKGIYDFVIITEMLGAATILGSNSLFEQFKKRVTNCFYYTTRDKENRYHEGYLRGILGEIHSLLTRLKPPETINPKDDALRPIKSLLSALKLVYGVHKVNAWNIIDDLKMKNPQREQQYDHLEQALSFFELFRHLYQITVAQDEDISLDEPGIEAMVAKIAEMIGFEKKGVVTAKDFMLVNYYEFLERSINDVEILTGDLKKHLRDVSIFKPIYSGDIYNKTGYKGNLAVDFIRASRFFKGTTYWDDFLERLSEESGLFYSEFVSSFNELSVKMRRIIGLGYIAGIKYEMTSVLRFLVVLGEKAKTDEAKDMFNFLNRLFIDQMAKLPGVSTSLAHIVYVYPGLLNSFLSFIDWETLDKFMNIARIKPAMPELIPIHKQLLALGNIHYRSSQFFKRHFRPVLKKYPVYIKDLYNNDKLKEIAAGFYSDLTTLPTLRQRIEQLGDYYDLEFVRVSLLAMRGTPCELTDAEFTEFCDNYTNTLYSFCHQDVHLSLGYSMHTHDLFALYATGGHAREQGFDDDYDMIVILNSSEPDEIDYCNKIVGKMNSEILKRGILPHHRFADHFGSYVVSFDQLSEHLKSKGEEIFIDQSQILSSRMLVGSSKLEEKLQQEIISPHIFSRGREYIDYMVEEMRSRHAEVGDEHCNDVKECCGGLRDIEMLLLMYKTKHKVRDPLSRKFLHRLVELEPQHAEKFRYVEKHLNFIKNLRDLYRLKVAAHNVISREYLPPVATSMGYGDDDKVGEKLYKDFLANTEKAGKIINQLVEAVKV